VSKNVLSALYVFDEKIITKFNLLYGLNALHDQQPSKLLLGIRLKEKVKLRDFYLAIDGRFS